MVAKNMKKSDKEKVCPETYRSFVMGIDIEDISFKRGSFELLAPLPRPSKNVAIEVGVKDIAKLTSRSQESFSIEHNYQLTCVNENNRKEKYFKIVAKLVVQYSSEKEIGDEVFEIFKEVNLPLNTWPYFREYVQNCMGRMNVPPVTLPAVKRS